MQTKSAEKKIKRGETYKYSKQRIIRCLEITNQEMETLTQLTNRTDRKACNRRSYLKRIKKEGKETKQKKIENRKKAIIALMEKGISSKDICKELKISRATFQRDLLKIKLEKWTEEKVDETNKIIHKIKKWICRKGSKEVKSRTIKRSVSFFKFLNYKSSVLLRFSFRISDTS